MSTEYDAAERAWRWVFEFKVKPSDRALDEENSLLFDEKIKWLVENEDDDHILRTFAVLKANLPPPSIFGAGRENFEAVYGPHVYDGLRGGPWLRGFDRPVWAHTMKTPKEQLV